jgi:2-oxoglutarate dehydrogenase E2 component (dihydrolipoamide succinyltransferase)
MPTKVIMPQLGESVDEGTITKWLKSIGDTIEEFEPILEINTDKVDTEIPSPASGVLLTTLAEEGETVTAGTLLAWIGEPGEAIPTDQSDTPKTKGETSSSKADESNQTTSSSTIQKQKASAQYKVASGRHPDLGFLSPVVTRIASEYNIDLYQITGTGRDGRITKGDIQNYIQRAQETAKLKVVQSKPQPAQKMTKTTGEILPLTRVRKAIAEHMVFSKHTSPHVSTIMEVDLSQVISHRNANKEHYAKSGVKLTFTPYFISATVAALKAYPIVNSSWGEEGILLHHDINIGMATSLGEDGLIVPVIKNADSLSLLGLARLVNTLAQRARARQLQPDDVTGGTFSITNHGISGSLFATPIINQPQCGILAIGAIQKRVVVISDEELGDSIAIRPMAYLTFTFDHRILDGAVADYFLGKIVDVLQNWH